MDTRTRRAELQRGERLGSYEIQSVCGCGSSAITYRARDMRRGILVALKVPEQRFLSDSRFVVRFLQEGTIGARLHHGSIVRVFEAGEDRDRLYIAMELVNGSTLARVLREKKRFDLERALRIAHAVSRALDHAHARGVIHRDLKPANVMLLPGDHVKVMDFGIARVFGQARLTSSNIFLGTPIYAAPESVDPKQITSAVDLYALGIILFEMVQGRPPFVAESVLEALDLHRNEPLPDCSSLPHPVPPSVWTLIEALCSKRPAGRPATADEVSKELNRLLKELSS